LTGSNISLTSSLTSLIGAKTSLTGLSREPGSSSKVKNKTRPGFKELLAKYEREGSIQKQKKQPNKVKDVKLSSRHQEQSVSYPHQGNYIAAPYGLIVPCFWPYPYYYAPLDYSRMHIQLYFIQYPSIYPSYGSSQRPIVASNNLVKKDFDCSKEGEKGIKQDSKYLQPRWCPLGLSHTQKRRLQRMHKK